MILIRRLKNNLYILTLINRPINRSKLYKYPLYIVLLSLKRKTSIKKKFLIRNEQCYFNILIVSSQKLNVCCWWYISENEKLIQVKNLFSIKMIYALTCLFCSHAVNKFHILSSKIFQIFLKRSKNFLLLHRHFILLSRNSKHSLLFYLLAVLEYLYHGCWNSRRKTIEKKRATSKQN